MSNIVQINATRLQVVEYRSERVVTLAQVDQVHERPEGTARRNFNEHRARFVEGIDFFELDQPDEIRSLGLTRPQGGTPGKVILITEAGYTMLVKPFNDDLAWNVQRLLVTRYFAGPETTNAIARKPAPPPVRLAYDAAKAFPPLFRVARLLGCDKNAAAISANQMVTKLTDVNLMAGLGQIHLDAEKQDTQFFTPTELGKRIGTSARGVNLLLAEAGMQMKRGDVWEVTEAGREFARILDTGKRHGSGVPIQQVKWSPNVLPLLGNEKEAA